MKIFQITENKIILLVLLLLALYGGLLFYEDYKINKKLEIEKQQEDIYVSKLAKKITALDLEAKAVSIYSLEKNKKIYGYNDSTPLPLASLTKTMTALALLGYDEENITISAEALAQKEEGGLKLGEVWSHRELAKLMLVSSSNDAAFALAEHFNKDKENFARKINDRAKLLGLNSLTFYNPSGLDESGEQAGAYGSAEDANMLAVYFYKAFPDIAYATTLPTGRFIANSGREVVVQNTDPLTAKRGDILFSKTGFTNLAGGNLSLIAKSPKGERFAITILASSKDGRFTDLEKILDALYDL